MLRTRHGLAVLILCALATAGPARAVTRDQAQQAVTFQKTQNWHGLAALAAQATRADPKDGWGWYYAGLADDGLGDRAAAAAAYEKALPLIPAMLQDAVVQVLAEDYAALKENAKLLALYHQMQTSNPTLAQSLQSQFPQAIVVTPPAPVLPTGLPALAAQAGATARRWQPDAALVMIHVTLPQTGAATTEFDFYSAKTQEGWTLTLSKGAWSPFSVGHAPSWQNKPLPAQFLDLPAALAAAQKGGMHDAAFEARLAYWSKPDKTGRFGWLVAPATFDYNHPTFLVDAASGALLDPLQWVDTEADNAQMNKIIAQERAANLARQHSHVNLRLADPALQRWVACATGTATLGRATFVAPTYWQAFSGLLIPVPDNHVMFVPLIRSPYWWLNAPTLGPNRNDWRRRPFHISDPPYSVYFYDRDEWNPSISGTDLNYLTGLYSRGCG